MRLGILSDIHEAVVPLRNALERFQTEGIDQLVLLGDIFEVGKRLEETVELLLPHRPVGVWGNHDWGLCGEVSDQVRSRFSPQVFDFMQTLKPCLEIDGFFFQHIEPERDATKIEDLWHWPEPPLLEERYERCFQGTTHRRMLMGHHHRWLVTTPDGVLPWRGEGPIELRSYSRILMVVHALMMGHAAILDTTSEILTPLSIPGAENFVYESRLKDPATGKG